jgi:hypothetical protein
MKEFTEQYDSNKNPINEGDVLRNPIMRDLWIVEKKNDIWYANLIPHSGFAGHPEDAEYPYYTEELDTFAEEFEKIGNIHDNPELMNANGCMLDR